MSHPSKTHERLLSQDFENDDDDSLLEQHGAEVELQVKDSFDIDRDWERARNAVTSSNSKTRMSQDDNPPIRLSLEDGSGISDTGTGSQAELRRAYWRNAAVNGIFVLAWYLFATLISVYNKWMFAPEHYNFGYPLFVTSFHMVVQCALAALTLSLFPKLRPSNRPTWHEYGTKAAPCGMATGLDIGLSNASLKTITLSFYTMCKSSALAFVLLFAFLFRLERPSWRLTGIIAIITVGVVLMVSEETKFDLWGMIEVLTASALGGLRWSLTQMLLDREAMGMSNPLVTIYYLAPVMAITLVICSAVFEGFGVIFSNEDAFGSIQQTMKTFGLILFPGFLAFFMNVAEFGLIQRTSVVTLSVCGIFKEVGTISVAAVVFHDELTPLNITGLIVTLSGIGLFNYFKYKTLTKDPQTGRSAAGDVLYEAVPMEPASSSHNGLESSNHRRSNSLVHSNGIE